MGTEWLTNCDKDNSHLPRLHGHGANNLYIYEWCAAEYQHFDSTCSSWNSKHIVYAPEIHNRVFNKTTKMFFPRLIFFQKQKSLIYLTKMVLYVTYLFGRSFYRLFYILLQLCYFWYYWRLAGSIQRPAKKISKS